MANFGYSAIPVAKTGTLYPAAEVSKDCCDEAENNALTTPASLAKYV